MKSLTFIAVFLSFFAVACGGKESDCCIVVDDDETTDEVTDETSDETADGATEAEIDEVSDGDIVENENETDEDEETLDEDSGEVTYHEPENLDECQNSVCSEVCVVEWDQMGKDVIFYLLNGDSIEKYSDCPVRIKLEIGSNDKCYTTVIETAGCNVTAGLDGRKEANSSMPISGLLTYGTDKVYYELSETDETIQEDGVFNYTRWENCINTNGVDLCEKYGLEKVQIEGESFGLASEEKWVAISQ